MHSKSPVAFRRDPGDRKLPSPKEARFGNGACHGINHWSKKEDRNRVTAILHVRAPPGAFFRWHTQHGNVAWRCASYPHNNHPFLQVKQIALFDGTSREHLLCGAADYRDHRTQISLKMQLPGKRHEQSKRKLMTQTNQTSSWTGWCRPFHPTLPVGVEHHKETRPWRSRQRHGQTQATSKPAFENGQSPAQDNKDHRVGIW